MSSLTFTLYADGPSALYTTDGEEPDRELIAFVSRRCVRAGFPDTSALAASFGTKNPAKVQRALATFFMTGCLHPAYMDRLGEVAGFSREDVARFRKAHRERLERDVDLLAANADLLLKRSDEIVARPEWSDVIARGVHVRSAWVSRRRPLTLGELLCHWKRGEFLAEGGCHGDILVFAASGSALSGANSYRGFCRACGLKVEGSLASFSAILGPFLDYEPGRPFAPSPVSLEGLIGILRREGRD